MAMQQPAFRPIRLYVANGSLVCRYYEANSAASAVVWLGGVGGGFDSPAHDIFDRMAAELISKQVSSLRIRYRLATDLTSSVEDALVGLEFLESRGVRAAITVGYSLGGAVAIQSAAALPLAAGVIGLASQSYGTSGAELISPRPLLLVHGADDRVMPPECSRLIFERAREPKQLIVVPGAGHSFDDVESELHQILADFISENLRLAKTAS
ncbi:MAG TPA: dienelactone hydrolase family protein [Chloroflexota bacterium]|nr:dienelactone hydrolase family protein [Chloroflexota bacterium]